MEFQTDTLGMLDLLTAPGFCVKDYIIQKVNSTAQGLFFRPGMDIRQLIRIGHREYADFSQGCLYLSLDCEGNTWGASVIREKEQDIFLLDQSTAQPELQALALAARELRSPLNNTMMITDQLLQDPSPQYNDSLSRLNRGLYQLLRIIDNMSDAEYWYAGSHQESRNIISLMEEILSKAQERILPTGIAMTYSLPQDPIYTLCSSEQLERAVLNMLSNAVKFTPAGGSIQVALTRQDNTLRLSVMDSGSTIADEILNTVFTRYRRPPVIEDSRHGIGLGMVIIRNTAANHGGTVLVDRPENAGTRITMTLAIRNNEGVLNSPIRLPLSGGYDSGLIQLSEVLPPQMYNGNQ